MSIVFQRDYQIKTKQSLNQLNCVASCLIMCISRNPFWESLIIKYQVNFLKMQLIYINLPAYLMVTAMGHRNSQNP